MFKRSFAALMAGVLCTGMLAGCGSSTTTDNASAADTSSTAAASTAAYEGNLTMLFATKDEYLSYLDQSAQAYAEVQNCTLDTIDCGESIDKQIEYVQAAVQEGAKAILIVTADISRTQDLIDAAGETPLVFVNRCPSDTSLLDETHLYVGSDENASGAYQGEELVSYCKDNSIDTLNYIMFKGNEGHDSTNKRSAGVLQALEDAGITANAVTEPITCNFDRTTAMNEMTNLLSGGLDMSTVNCIISNNDAMAMGAIEACNMANIDLNNAAIVGVDGVNDALKAVSEGTMVGTVYQNAKAQASAGVQAAINLAGGNDYMTNISYETAEDNDYTIWIPFDKVTADNISDFYK